MLRGWRRSQNKHTSGITTARHPPSLPTIPPSLPRAMLGATGRTAAAPRPQDDSRPIRAPQTTKGGGYSRTVRAPEDGGGQSGSPARHATVQVSDGVRQAWLATPETRPKTHWQACSHPILDAYKADGQARPQDTPIDTPAHTLGIREVLTHRE